MFAAFIEFLLFLLLLYCAYQDLKRGQVSLFLLIVLGLSHLSLSLMRRNVPPFKHFLFLFFILAFSFLLLWLLERRGMPSAMGSADLLLPLILFPDLGLIKSLLLIPIASFLAFPCAILLLAAHHPISTKTEIPLYPFLIESFLLLRWLML